MKIPFVLLDLIVYVQGDFLEIEAKLPHVLGLGSLPYWCPRAWRWLSSQAKAQRTVMYVGYGGCCGASYTAM